jgi:hypothetical protein
MALVVQQLPSNLEALSSKPNTVQQQQSQKNKKISVILSNPSSYVRNLLTKSNLYLLN